jgi:hypothetical protein
MKAVCSKKRSEDEGGYNDRGSVGLSRVRQKRRAQNQVGHLLSNFYDQKNYSKSLKFKRKCKRTENQNVTMRATTPETSDASYIQEIVSTSEKSTLAAEK